MTRLLFFFAVLLTALPASAASRLDTLLARGERLTARGDVACLVPLQSAAFAAEGNNADYARALGALGLCHEIAGHYSEAHRLVSRALEGAPPDTTVEGRARRWVALRAALRRLDDRVARVLVDFPAELWIDGRPTLAVSGAVLAVDPGTHLLEAREKGRTIAAAQVTARAGDLPSVKLTTSIPRGEPANQAVSVLLPPRLIPRPSLLAPALSLRGAAITVAYVGAGTALVAGIVAGVLEAQRQSLASGLARDACPTPDASVRCAQLRQVFEQSRGARNVALVAGGVAVLGIGAAVSLWFGVERKPASAGLMIGGAW